jgi:hypothetical protein
MSPSNKYSNDLAKTRQFVSEYYSRSESVQNLDIDAEKILIKDALSQYHIELYEQLKSLRDSGASTLSGFLRNNGEIQSTRDGFAHLNKTKHFTPEELQYYKQELQEIRNQPGNSRYKAQFDNIISQIDDMAQLSSDSPTLNSRNQKAAGRFSITKACHHYNSTSVQERTNLSTQEHDFYEGHLKPTRDRNNHGAAQQPLKVPQTHFQDAVLSTSDYMDSPSTYREIANGAPTTNPDEATFAQELKNIRDKSLKDIKPNLTDEVKRKSFVYNAADEMVRMRENGFSNKQVQDFRIMFEAVYCSGSDNQKRDKAYLEQAIVNKFKNGEIDKETFERFQEFSNRPLVTNIKGERGVTPFATVAKDLRAIEYDDVSHKIQTKLTANFTPEQKDIKNLNDIIDKAGLSDDKDIKAIVEKYKDPKGPYANNPKKYLQDLSDEVGLKLIDNFDKLSDKKKSEITKLISETQTSGSVSLRDAFEDTGHSSSGQSSSGVAKNNQINGAHKPTDSHRHSTRHPSQPPAQPHHARPHYTKSQMFSFANDLVDGVSDKAERAQKVAIVGGLLYEAYEQYNNGNKTKAFAALSGAAGIVGHEIFESKIIPKMAEWGMEATMKHIAPKVAGTVLEATAIKSATNLCKGFLKEAGPLGLAIEACIHKLMAYPELLNDVKGFKDAIAKNDTKGAVKAILQYIHDGDVKAVQDTLSVSGFVPPLQREFANFVEDRMAKMGHPIELVSPKRDAERAENARKAKEAVQEFQNGKYTPPLPTTPADGTGLNKPEKIPFKISSQLGSKGGTKSIEPEILYGAPLQETEIVTNGMEGDQTRGLRKTGATRGLPEVGASRGGGEPLILKPEEVLPTINISDDGLSFEDGIKLSRRSEKRENKLFDAILKENKSLEETDRRITISEEVFILEVISSLESDGKFSRKDFKLAKELISHLANNDVIGTSEDINLDDIKKNVKGIKALVEELQR